jgi:transposase InsO family protein
MKKLPFESTNGIRTTKPLQMVHTDVGGPITPISREGQRYWIVIVDDFTWFPWVYFMKHKNETLAVYKQWRSDIKAFFRQEVEGEHFTLEALEYLRSDNGGEYTSAKFRTGLRSDGVRHETSAPDTPEQNGLAERMNQTLSTLANTMLEESKLPKSFWADAMTTAAFVTGRSPADGIGGKTPYEVLFNRRADSGIFRSFGCPAYALIPKDK